MPVCSFVQRPKTSPGVTHAPLFLFAVSTYIELEALTQHAATLPAEILVKVEPLGMHAAAGLLASAAVPSKAVAAKMAALLTNSLRGAESPLDSQATLLPPFAAGFSA